MSSTRLDNRFKELQQALTPLMQLVCKVTGLETAFVTYIDPILARQQVAVVVGNGEIGIVEGSEIDWQDSMCRLLLNDEHWQDNEIKQHYPLSAGAALGMNTFFAVPVQHKKKTIGTVCGVSTRDQHLTLAQHEQLQLIAEAVSWTLAQWQRLVKLQQRLQFTRQRLQLAYQDRDSLKALAERDPLTGLLNRRGFADFWQRCTEVDTDQKQIAVITLDFDNFKQLNDNFGHQAGDEALQALGAILQQHTRDYDFAARLGGDEFLLVLPGCRRVEAMEVASRIQQSYQASPFGDKHGISIGIAVTEQGANDDLLLLADKALYQAKNSGRGHIVCRTLRT